MKSGILEKSTELFRKAKDENTLGSWRGYVDALVKLTLELSDGERQELLGEAARRREAITDPSEERFLWFFSHGSDTIFKKFLSEHTGLHYPLAQFLLKTNQEKSENEISDTEVVQELAWRYATLLRCSDCQYFFTPPPCKTCSDIHLIPKPLSTPESIVRVTSKWRPDIAREVVNEYLSLYYPPTMLDQCV